MHIRIRSVAALTLLAMTALTGCAPAAIETTVTNVIPLPSIQPAPIADLAEDSGFTSSMVGGELQIAIGAGGLSNNAAADLAARLAASTTDDEVAIVRTLGPLPSTPPEEYACAQAFRMSAGPPTDGHRLAATLHQISSEECWRHDDDHLYVWTSGASVESAFGLAWVLRTDGLATDAITTVAGRDPAAGDVSLEVHLDEGEEPGSPALAAFTALRDGGVITSGRIDNGCLATVDADADLDLVRQAFESTPGYPYAECLDAAG